MTRRKSPRQKFLGIKKAASDWGETLKALVKPMLLAIVTSFASVLAYVVTPLNELINATIWDEKAEIEVISQIRSPKQGDVITVDIFYPAQITSASFRRFA